MRPKQTVQMSFESNHEPNCVVLLSENPDAIKCHPPSLPELLRGFPFFRDSLRADMTAFLRDAGQQGDAELGVSLENIVSQTRLATRDATVSEILPLVRVFDSLGGTTTERVTVIEEWVERCHFYCAVSGHLPSSWRVAAYAVAAAYSRKLPEALVGAHMAAAVGWLLVATGKLPAPQGWTGETGRMFLQSVASPGALEAVMNLLPVKLLV